MVFPGTVLEVPADRDPIIVDSDSKKKKNRGELCLIVFLVVIIVGPCSLLVPGTFTAPFIHQKNRFREDAVHFAVEYFLVRLFLYPRKRIVVEKSKRWPALSS